MVVVYTLKLPLKAHATGEVKKEEKAIQKLSTGNTFEAIAREWHKSKADDPVNNSVSLLLDRYYWNDTEFLTLPFILKGAWII